MNSYLELILNYTAFNHKGQTSDFGARGWIKTKLLKQTIFLVVFNQINFNAII